MRKASFVQQKSAEKQLLMRNTHAKHPSICMCARCKSNQNKQTQPSFTAMTPLCTGARCPRGQALCLLLAEEKEKLRKSELLPAFLSSLAHHESSTYAQRIGLQAPEGDPRFQHFQKGQRRRTLLVEMMEYINADWRTAT